MRAIKQPINVCQGGSIVDKCKSHTVSKVPDPDKDGDHVTVISIMHNEF